MSWAQHRQPANMPNPPPLVAPLQQQQLQSHHPPQPVGVGVANTHGTSAHFGPQPVWQQGYNQQPMQPTQQAAANNWAVGDVYQLHNVAPPSLQQPPAPNNWPQPELHATQPAVPSSGYFLNQENFSHSSQHQQYPNLQQQSYQAPQQFAQQNVQQPVENTTTLPVSYSRQSTQQMDNEHETGDYFEKNGNNNNNDGWGDWDWNDNTVHQQQSNQQPATNQQQQYPQQPPAPLPEPLRNNLNPIEESFRTEHNDNWQWGAGQVEQTNHEQKKLILEDLHQNSQQPPPQDQIENLVPPPPINFKTLTTSPHPQPQQQKSTITQTTGIQHQAVHSTAIAAKPTNLPLNDAAQSPEVAQNSNNNNNNNIPSPVYVSQAKPVSKPPRQYASPPGTVNDVPNAIGRPTTPPHAFRTEPQPESVPSPPSLTAALPPPMKSSPLPSSAANNPFKRAGLAQHHRAGMIGIPLNSQPMNMVPAPSQVYTSPPPPPEDFANPSVENNEVIAPDNSEVLHENQEIAPNNDRNEYLQTSHLSEVCGRTDATFNIEMQEQNNESDDFPPPGLSRLVLGQPENELRQVPGNEVENSLNIERQADGEDTDRSQQRSAFIPSTESQNIDLTNQIDITADRNLYLVPGESDVHEQRVVTGLENRSTAAASVPPIQVEQRELELDGENIEDQHQPLPAPTSQHHHALHRPVSPAQTSRDEPLEGANSLDRQVQGSQHTNHETESSMTVETNVKDLSNISTGNDESDQRDRHYGKSRRGGGDDHKKRRSGNEVKDKRYESEESEFSSDRERRRYREGSVRGERERDSKERKRRDKRDRDVDRERDRYRIDDRENRYRKKVYRDSREGNGSWYKGDPKYDGEYSSRLDRRRGADRSERGDREAHDDYRRMRKYNTRDDRELHERRTGGTRGDGERRRGDRDYRDDREPRRHKDSREKPRSEYEEYRKTSSRNTRESDIEKDSRLREKDPRYVHGMYSGYPGYGYDPYAAYYYEQMVRTNPQAYSEWYKKYYENAQAPESMTNDGRESVHSGRSSANNEKDRYSVQHHQYIPYSNDYHGHFMHSHTMAANMSATMNSTMIELHQEQQQRGYRLSGGLSTGNLSQINQFSGSAYYPSTSRSHYARSECSESRPDNLSLNLAETAHSSIQQDPQRLTPYKFMNEHPVISLGAGVMVAVKPNYSQNGVTNIVKIFKMGANDSTNKLFQSFPGPLVRGLTHKKTIIEFCEDQIRQGPNLSENSSRHSSVNGLAAAGQTNTSSFTLMWNLLILLLRQNGVVVGTDIAELLMKNQQQFPYEAPQSFSSSNREPLQSNEQRKQLKEQKSSDAEPEVDVSVKDDFDESDETESKTSILTEDEITEKFRNYLLYGNVNEALDWATDNNLWGHALFLASKVDRRSHANVMMKFANKLSLNDPLQTLYQLMSGRTPSSVTSVQDEKWGDWRPHLAMILSNTSQKPELDRKAITTLGDSLFNRGDLYAAHFCYLMAQVGFSKYPEEQSETNLMQSSVRLVLLGSSHNKPFEEFASNESIMMTEVYEYACSLNDEKFSLPEFQHFKFLLATRMLDYGYQLKCLMYMEQISLHIQRDQTKYKPIFIQQVYEIADRLKYYDPVLEKSMDEVQMDENAYNSNGIPFEEQKWLQTLRSLAASCTAAQPSHEYDQDPQKTSQVIDQQFSEINRRFDELNMQYNNTDGTMQPQQQHQLQKESTDVQFHSKPENNNLVPSANEQHYPTFYNPSETYQTQPIATEGIDYNNGGYGQMQEGYHQQHQQPSQPLYTYGQEEQHQQQHQQQQQQNTYEYWNNQQETQNDETTRPTISMPNSKSGYYEDAHLDDTAAKANDVKKSNNQGTSASEKTDIKNQSKGGQSSNQNSGWFGGIWNKLSLKPKNQMILPDDKNPAIVWDPEKKKWVNTDGDEEGDESLKPPPKMADLMPKTQQAFTDSHKNHHLRHHEDNSQQHSATQPPMQSIPSATPMQPYSATMSAVPQMPGEPAKAPSLQSNMFKMQRNRTLKNSYVDVFNPSGAAPKVTEQVLAPALPPAAVPVAGIFVPGAPSGDGAYQQHQQAPAQEGVPQFYNPNQFGYQQ